MADKATELILYGYGRYECPALDSTVQVGTLVVATAVEEQLKGKDAITDRSEQRVAFITIHVAEWPSANALELVGEAFDELMSSLHLRQHY